MLKIEDTLIIFDRRWLDFTFGFPGSFSVFQPSSFYTIVHTNHGLKMQIQLSPVMQLFLIMEDFAKGTLQGKSNL